MRISLSKQSPFGEDRKGRVNLGDEDFSLNVFPLFVSIEGYIRPFPPPSFTVELSKIRVKLIEKWFSIFRGY